MTHSVLPLSVVIPTLGGEALKQTLETLLTGPYIPSEILVCLPNSLEENSFSDTSITVKLIYTPYRGQVPQRAYGLSLATQPIVMQLDDDVLVDSRCLKILFDSAMALGKGNIVSPLGWHYMSTGNYISTDKTGLKGWLENLYLYLVCGSPWGTRKMGKLIPAGIGFWIDRTKVSANQPFETELLPGGCTLCHREDLILDHYFPFPGKAYCEDLIHSILWRKRGMRLWAIPSADATTPVETGPNDWNVIAENYRAHRYVVELLNGSKVRLLIWFSLMVSRAYIRNIISNYMARAKP